MYDDSEVIIQEEAPLNSYRTEIPNIVFDIGLTPYELALYSHFRRTAGTTGKCTKGARRLAEETGMSLGQIVNARRSLEKGREEIGGKPLIKVAEVADEKCGKRIIVTIVDVWRDNYERFKRVHMVNTPVHGMNTPCSYGERKKEPSKGIEAKASSNSPEGKSKPLKVLKVEVSERGMKFADWFRSTLNNQARLTSTWREQFGQCFDDLIRLDCRTPEQIHAVCEWARRDDFWAGNFLSPLKLRQKKDGVMYFDIFVERMSRPIFKKYETGAQRKARESQGQYALSPDDATPSYDPMQDPDLQ